MPACPRALGHDRQNAGGAVGVLKHSPGDGELAALEVGGLVAIGVRLETTVGIEAWSTPSMAAADHCV